MHRVGWVEQSETHQHCHHSRSQPPGPDGGQGCLRLPRESKAYSTASSSTSNVRVAFGGIVGSLPSSP